jgi:chromosome segregation ATPase
LRVNAVRFARILKETPLDLKPIREVYDGLSRFEGGLTSLHATLNPHRMDAMREGVQGAEQVVSEAARLAERAANFTYPTVTLDGMKPRVNDRPFWPGAPAVSANMRKVGGDMAALDREMEVLAKELPELEAAVAESYKSVSATRKVLVLTLSRRTEIERLLADGTEQAAHLSKELPGMTRELSRALRSFTKLKEVAVALRESQKGIDSAIGNWPKMQTGLTGSATLLRATRDQLDEIIRRRREYEAELDQTERLSFELAELFPAFTDGAVRPAR